MPGRNVIKTYVKNGFYHIYNRGVDKRVIFLDDQDYIYFLFLLKQYLSKELKVFNLKTKKYEVINNEKSIDFKIQLLSYCLMPNHFHLLVKQLEHRSIDEFMRKLCTSYSLYFNKKYKRQGTLFQGRYKAVLIETEKQLIHVSRYIHLNPLELVNNKITNLWCFL